MTQKGHDQTSIQLDLESGDTVESNKEELVQRRQNQKSTQSNNEIVTIPEEMDTQLSMQIQSKKLNHLIDPGEAQENYLKLISGTSLEKDHTKEEDYHFKPGEQSESLAGDDNSLDDMD